MQHHMDQMLNDMAEEQRIRTRYEAEMARETDIEAYRALQAEMVAADSYEAMKEAVLYATFQEAEDAYYIREAEAAGYMDYPGFGQIA